MFELVIIWNDGKKEIYIYKNRMEAEKGKYNIEQAFGLQIWVCVREKRI